MIPRKSQNGWLAGLENRASKNNIQSRLTELPNEDPPARAACRALKETTKRLVRWELTWPSSLPHRPADSAAIGLACSPQSLLPLIAHFQIRAPARCPWAHVHARGRRGGQKPRSLSDQCPDPPGSPSCQAAGAFPFCPLSEDSGLPRPPSPALSLFSALPWPPALPRVRVTLLPSFHAGLSVCCHPSQKLWLCTSPSEKR